jgi:hypothetical protein
MSAVVFTEVSRNNNKVRLTMDEDCTRTAVVAEMRAAGFVLDEQNSSQTILLYRLWDAIGDNDAAGVIAATNTIDLNLTQRQNPVAAHIQMVDAHTTPIGPTTPVTPAATPTYPRFQDVRLACNTAVFPVLRQIREDDRESMVAVLSRFVETDVASRAKLAVDKTLEYNKLLSKMVVMRREIDELNAEVGSHPVIARVREQLDELRADTIVSEAFVSENDIVIRTANICTNAIGDLSPRRIGRMEFRIKLSLIMGKTAGADPVLIHNMDRELIVSETMGYECPHVNLQGHACFGSMTGDLVNALAQRDIVGAFSLLVRFVKTPKLGDSWGRNSKMWPEATPQ